MQTLLEHGATPRAVISVELIPLRVEFRTALEAACYYARVDAVDVLAESVRTSEGAHAVRPFINQQSGRGRTALMRASIACATSCAARLLELRALPDLVDRDGMTALLFACSLQNPMAANNRLVSLLIAADADPDKPHRETGVTALMFAAGNGHVLAVTELIRSGANIHHVANCESALLWATRTPDAKVVSKLMLAGARHDVCDAEGRNGLHLAAQYGCHEVLNALLAQPDEQRASVNLKSADGHTPLMLAVRHGWWKCVRALVSAKDTDLEQQDARGQTALDMSHLIDDLDCAKEIERELNERALEADREASSPHGSAEM